MRTFLFALLICTTPSLFAQKDCASSSYLTQELASDPALAGRLADLERFVQKRTAVSPGLNLRTSKSGVIKIPVVVHVLYNTAAENISDEQIQSQLDALNRDFRRQNADTANTPARFKNVAADVEIEFHLATADPKGRETSGVIRKKTNVTGWLMNDKIKFNAQGGDDAWDSRYYLNIWVGNLRSALGYATVPGSDAAKDGLVISYNAFGTINAPAPYELGRTAVHEIGHWLGLKHIWGDGYCGDDFVPDTPPQGGFTSGCPSTFRSTCNNGSLGDMYMNYMDFTNDACMNLFTKGQRDRMRSFFEEGGARATMLKSKGLFDPWVWESPLPTLEIKDVKLYPNPATDVVNLTFADESWTGKKLQIFNSTGVLVSDVVITGRTMKVQIGSFNKGIYFIKAENDGVKFLEKLVKL